MTQKEFLEQVQELTQDIKKSVKQANKPLNDLHKEFGKKNIENLEPVEETDSDK